jgi:hypothetical protein
VTVVLPPLVLVPHGAAATDRGANTPTEAKTSAADEKAIATDRMLRMSSSLAV